MAPWLASSSASQRAISFSTARGISSVVGVPYSAKPMRPRLKITSGRSTSWSRRMRQAAKPVAAGGWACTTARTSARWR